MEAYVRILVALAAAVTFVAMPVSAQDPQPIKFVDVHMHMMVENITPDEEIALMKKVGVSRAVFMHNEPDKLQEIAKRYEDQDEWDLSQHTHEFPEWQKNEAGKSCRPIPLEDILQAVDRVAERADLCRHCRE